MANASGHGGYREPARPAPASGPGRLSKRTDGGAAQKMRKMTGGSYGEASEMADLQRSAPMGATAPASSAQGPIPVDGSSLTGLAAPTGNPNVGVLDGIGQATPPPSGGLDDKTRARLSASLPTLLWLASQPSASEATRQFVRQLRGDL